MPRFPSDRTLLGVPDWDEDEKEASEMMVEEMEMSDDNEEDNPDKLPKMELLRRRFRRVLKKVKDVLEDEKALEEIWEKVPEKGNTVEEYETNRRLRIREMLKKAGVEEDMYYMALQHSPKGYVVIQKRDLDEIMVNSYNKEWMECWDGNMDLTFCFDFFGIITYMTEYFVKDETKTMEAIKAVLKSNPTDDTKEKMKVIANAFMVSRQIGESEGFYKLMPDLLLKNSNVTCVWLTLEDPATKMKRMRRVMEDGATEENQRYKKIEGVEGLWMEQSDLLSK